MSKRFIDTELFDDEWFMELSKDSKLLWLYMITKCDHAGMISLNKRLIQFQTGIKDLDKCIKELSNRLVTVSEVLYFIPKYIDFQYPNFPNSRVKQQESAINILLKYGLFDNIKQTVKQGLINTYDNDNVIDNVIDSENEDDNSEFPKGFEDIITDWMQYKKEKKQTYQPKGLSTFIKHLLEYSDNEPINARKIVDYSMANNYSGIFKPNNNTKNLNDYETKGMFAE